MLRMQQHQEGVMRRLSVIGIPPVTRRPFLDLLVKWENGSGVEWTIKRLKSLKVDLLRTQAGLPTLCSHTWVRKNSKGEFAGVIGSLFRWARCSERNFSRTLQAFQAYTFYILPSLTETQKEKFLKGINPSRTADGLSEEFHKSFAQTVKRTIRRRFVGCSHKPLVIYQGSPDKKAPRLFGKRSVPQDKEILDDIQIFDTQWGQSLYLRFSELYRPLLQGLGFRVQHLNFLQEANMAVRAQVRGGEIHFIQEPGGKLRSVASPFRIHQEALRPLGDELYRLIRSLPWDCTHEQSRAIPSIQAHLAKGGQVHSVDLSSATDLFPLTLQETALRAIFHKESWNHINLFIEISRGLWSSQIGDLQWVKGQPLGLFPSFATFTLTHGLLLLHLAGGDYHQQFFVLGDDVIILEDELRDRYVAMLDQMGCPWSEDKSLSSNKLAEFAGKIVTSSGVYPQLKWRMMSDDNFLDICRLLGSKSRSLLNKRQKAVFDQVAHLCEPIGLNFSKPGSTLASMVEETLAFYRPEKVVLGSLMGLRKRINQMVYSHPAESFNSEELHDLAVTFDEKVRDVVTKTIFVNWELALSIGIDAFSSLPEALDLKPRLPLREYTPSRRSTLERYEWLLQSQRSTS